ncbi:hypothetical protein H6P81_001308 [Aristolochia fimbriata]|uniref:4-coumarate--CoA ligase-like 5 n=1 Tax=Aristolochia fimbriata TaxID=158543 RepID=A0AAV7F6I8_ARIFI|nr:hypothetical protein H6P81_001308 [Aristolochia fimbriata]
MASQETQDLYWVPEERPGGQRQRGVNGNSGGYCDRTGIYRSLLHLAPHHRPPPHLHTAEFVLSHFPHPDHAHASFALVDSALDRCLTYADLRRSVRSLAAALHHGLGVRKGDVVLLLAPNSYLYPPTCLALLSLGAVLTTANPLLTAAEVAKQARDSAAKLVVCSPDLRHKLRDLFDAPLLLTHRDAAEDSVVSVEELMEGGEPSEAPAPEIRRSDTAAVLYSSGTTGANKGCVLTHGNLVAIVNLLRWTAATKTLARPGDVFLAFLPMFHVYGLAFFALGLFATGATVVTMPRFDFDAMLSAVEKYGVTNLPSVPPVVLALVKRDATARYDLSTLRRVGCGAAPLSGEVAEGFRAKFPWVQLRQGYGLTETAGAATFFPSAEESRSRPSSAGVLFPGFEARVVEVGTGAAMPPGREGELWLRSDTVMKCYLGNEEATAGAIDSEGWLRTGDLGYFDEQGYLYVVDRIKELIKHNGYQVAPAELEALLLTHPDVLDAAVVPEEAEDVGQIPVAFVVRAADSQLTGKQVIQFVAEQVAPFKKVKKVSFISSIPRSAAGKILRKELIAQVKRSASKL